MVNPQSKMHSGGDSGGKDSWIGPLTLVCFSQHHTEYVLYHSIKTASLPTSFQPSAISELR